MKRFFLLVVIVFFSSINATVPEPIIENIESIIKKEKKIPIIAIGGCPGVGKSTFATILLEDLSQKNIHCLILSFDDFGKTLEEKKALKNELDIKRIRWDDLYSVLEAIKVGEKKIKIPKIDQLTQKRSERVLNLDEIDLIIFEGMYTLSNSNKIKLQSYANLKIYMETTTENICQWKWEREKKKTNPRTREQFEAHMALIFEDFIQFVYPTKQNADWIVFANDQHQFFVSRLK
jgi:uridine kinase